MNDKLLTTANRQCTVWPQPTFLALPLALEYIPYFSDLARAIPLLRMTFAPTIPFPSPMPRSQAYPGELLTTPQIPGPNASLLSGAPSQVVTFATVTFHTSPTLLNSFVIVFVSFY